jgi:arylsulfatase A-like enzyme/Flp pilus assembly protein TadD
MSRDKISLKRVSAAIALFLSVPIILTSAPAAIPREKPGLNLLLVTVDTLRADGLSCYDPSRVKTPNIDKVAGSGWIFTRAFAHNPLTLPSHANILLGTTPLYHGVHDNENFIVREEWLTLAELLKSHGYATGAFIGGFPLDARFGLNQGFDVYDDEFKPKGAPKYSSGERKAEEVVRKAVPWIKDKASPWFAWLHLYDPHAEYIPPEPYLSQYKSQPYYGEAAYVDFALGKLFQFMEENALFGTTVVILTSDHGESLGQHGEETHGVYVYNPTLWIPLIIRVPAGKPAKISQVVSHVDIFPTVCDILNIPAPAFLQGISLLPATKGKNLTPRTLYFEALDAYDNYGWAPVRGTISQNLKFTESPIPELYDLDKDFDETQNLAGLRPLGEFRSELAKTMEKLSHPESAKASRQPDRETAEILKSLGYVSGAGTPPKGPFGPADDVKSLLPLYVEVEFLLNKAKPEAAIPRLKEIISRNPRIYQPHLALAQLLIKGGKNAEALEVLTAGFQKYPGSYEIFALYCESLLAAGRYAAVVETFTSKDYIQKGREPKTWIILANALLKQNRVPEAIQALEKAASLDDGYADIFLNLGSACFSQFTAARDERFYARAVQNLEKAIQLNPDLAEAYNTLGAAYLVKGKLKEAIAVWERVVKISPEFPKAHYYLGLAYYGLNDLDNALKNFLRYKELTYVTLTPEEKSKLDNYIAAAQAKRRQSTQTRTIGMIPDHPLSGPR